MTVNGANIQDATSTTLYFGPWYRKSPFFEATLRSGCKAYDIYNHMYLPAYYDELAVEYWALVNDVTLWDVGVERVVEISGPDGFALANALTCRDLTRCAVGQGKYAPIIAPDGGICNGPVLLRRGENTFWLRLADGDLHLYAMGLAHGLGLDVTVSLPDVYPLQIQGPKARDLMYDLAGEAVLGVKYYRSLDTAIAGIPVVVSRTGWTGEIGAVIVPTLVTAFGVFFMRQSLVDVIPDELIDRPAWRRLHDDEVHQHDGEERRDHQKDAADGGGKHVRARRPTSSGAAASWFRRWRTPHHPLGAA